MPEESLPLPPLPESKRLTKRTIRLSPVWIVPIVAAAVGVWVAAAKIMSEGPTITLAFRSADGLEAGKTKIRYNGVDVGTVTQIRLSDDHHGVIATVGMEPKTESFLVTDTRFWIVRPRISGASISGLGTLVSGAYIRMDIGQAHDKERHFVGLETPPIVMRDVPGRYFLLKTADLGSLDNGTPIYFRRLQVGEVASYEFDKDGKGLTVKAFVQAPYDQFVTPGTRFWHASGIDVSMSPTGFNIQTQSLLSILVGGIAFETPTEEVALPAAPEDTTFTLYHDHTEAFRAPPRSPLALRMVFNQSVRGLAVGAPVEFRGIQIGEVVSVDAEVDAKTFAFSVPVTVQLESTRFGVQITDLAAGTDLEAVRKQLYASFVAHGVRAQLRSGSLLTGALYVALDFFPDAPPATLDWTATPVQFPTVPGALEGIESSLAGIVKKINEMPLKAIGDDLAKALVSLDGTLGSARGVLGNADKLIAPDAGLSAELSNTLEEVSRAARGLRGLADYLERHPEALIRGKTGKAE